VKCSFVYLALTAVSEQKLKAPTNQITFSLISVGLQLVIVKIYATLICLDVKKSQMLP